MPPNDQNRPIRILHLSDIHFRVDRGWDADPVLRALARFIRTEVERGLVPDLVVISGDLAFSGVKDEYALARDWLDRELWPALPDDLPRDRLLLTPGNHDVDRTKVKTGVRSIQNGLLEARSQDEIAAFSVTTTSVPSCSGATPPGSTSSRGGSASPTHHPGGSVSSRSAARSSTSPG